MAEEQRVNIPLDSPLEVTTDDMVVPSGNPTFHFNDQVFEAGIMANSFKYEHAGFAADHYSYEFSDDVVGDVDTNWPDGRIGKYGKILQLKDENGIVAKFSIDTTQSVGPEPAVITAWSRTGDVYTLTGTSSKGTPINVTLDTYTFELGGVPAGYNGSVTQGLTTIGIDIRKNAELDDTITYLPATVISVPFSKMRLTGIKGTGLETTFEFTQGTINLNDRDYVDEALDLISWVSDTSGAVDTKINIKCTEETTIPIAMNKGVNEPWLAWYLNSVLQVSLSSKKTESGQTNYALAPLQIAPASRQNVPYPNDQLGEVTDNIYIRRIIQGNPLYPPSYVGSIKYNPNPYVVLEGVDEFELDVGLDISPSPGYNRYIGRSNTFPYPKEYEWVPPFTGAFSLDGVVDGLAYLSFRGEGCLQITGHTPLADGIDLLAYIRVDDVWSTGALQSAIKDVAFSGYVTVPGQYDPRLGVITWYDGVQQGIVLLGGMNTNIAMSHTTHTQYSVTYVASSWSGVFSGVTTGTVVKTVEEPPAARITWADGATQDITAAGTYDHALETRAVVAGTAGKWNALFAGYRAADCSITRATDVAVITWWDGSTQNVTASGVVYHTVNQRCVVSYTAAVWGGAASGYLAANVALSRISNVRARITWWDGSTVDITSPGTYAYDPVQYFTARIDVSNWMFTAYEYEVRGVAATGGGASGTALTIDREGSLHWIIRPAHHEFWVAMECNSLLYNMWTITDITPPNGNGDKIWPLPLEVVDAVGSVVQIERDYLLLGRLTVTNKLFTWPEVYVDAAGSSHEVRYREDAPWLRILLKCSTLWGIQNARAEQVQRTYDSWDYLLDLVVLPVHDAYNIPGDKTSGLDVNKYKQTLGPWTIDRSGEVVTIMMQVDNVAFSDSNDDITVGLTPNPDFVLVMGGTLAPNPIHDKPLSISPSDPSYMRIQLRDDTVRQIILRNHVAEADGVFNPITIGSFSTNEARELKLTFETPIGNLIMTGTSPRFDIAGEYYVATDTILPDGRILFTLALSDILTAEVPQIGMIHRRYEEMHWISGTSVRQEFEYDGEDYYIELSADAFSVLGIDISDIFKNRQVRHIQLDANEYLLEEVVGLYNESVEYQVDLTRDRSSLRHSYYGITDEYQLAITQYQFRLFKEGVLIDTKDITEIFNAQGVGALWQWGVSSSTQNGIKPFLWCLYADDTRITIYAVDARADLEYPLITSWVSCQLELHSLVDTGGSPEHGSVLTIFQRIYIKQIAWQSVFSSARVGSKWLLGIKYDRGMGQWTVNIKTGQVILGFGSVGPDGLISGNFLPKALCNPDRGFIADVDVGRLELTANKVYNKDGQLYFCYSRLQGYVWAIKNGVFSGNDQIKNVLGWHDDRSNDSKMEGIPQPIIVDTGFGNTTGIALTYGGYAYIGYFHWGSVYLTGLKNRFIVKHMWERGENRIRIIPNPLLDSIMVTVMGAGSSVMDKAKELAEGPKYVTEEVPGTAGKFTTEQAAQMESFLGTGKAGSHSTADVDAYMDSIGVTDPGVRNAIQNGTVNPDGTNKSWRQNIADQIDNGTAGSTRQVEVASAATAVGAPASAPADRPVVPSPGVRAAAQATVVSFLSGLVDALVNPQFIYIKYSAELFVMSDIIPCCYPDQNVYSGPGWYSVQAVRKSRRQMQYFFQYQYLGNGFVINTAKLIADSSAKVAELVANGSSGGSMAGPVAGIIAGGVAGGAAAVAESFKTSPNLLPQTLGPASYTHSKDEDMTWVLGTHLYINGPTAVPNGLQYIESTIRCVIGSSILPYPEIPLSLFTEITWDWKLDTESIDFSGKWSVIAGNRGPDQEGFTRTSDPMFSTPCAYDALIFESGEIFLSYTGDEALHVAVRDTKIIDGMYSNIIVSNGATTVASSYNVVRATLGLEASRLKPESISTGLKFNSTGVNFIDGINAVHAFDSYTSRIIEWQGTVGGDVETLTQISQYVHNYLKRSIHTMMTPSAVFGGFISMPRVEYRHLVHIEAAGITVGTYSEDVSVFRICLPIFYKKLANFPVGAQTIAGYKLLTTDGITSLTTVFRTTDIRSFADVRDFFILGKVYRQSTEYVSNVQQGSGMVDIIDVVLGLGLVYIGTYVDDAWFYQRANRGIWCFTGAQQLEERFNAYRFKDLTVGEREFLKGYIAARANLVRDEHESRLIRFTDKAASTLVDVHEYIPNPKLVGSSAGMVLQGSARHQVIFHTFDENMFTLNLAENRGKWSRIPGDNIEQFFTKRKYNSAELPIGYYWEPFHLATSFLGQDDNTDCQFEWLITFAFTDWMYSIVGDKFVTVHVACETALPNGHKKSEVTHIRLRNNMFQRSTERIGYYSFRFNGRNGAGNSERLFIWSDGVMAIRKLELITRAVTQNRTQPLLTQPDFVALDEL
jgi:hypothetical protein